MGLRLFLVLLGVWVIYLVVRRTLKQRHSRGVTKSNLRSIDTVCCDRCGTHIAAPDALRFDGRYFCCPEHRGGRSDTGPGKEGV